MNECEKEGLCDGASTVCENTEGAYSCPCKSGYADKGNAHAQFIHHCEG